MLLSEARSEILKRNHGDSVGNRELVHIKPKNIMNTHKTMLTAGAVAAFACSLAFGQPQTGQSSSQSQPPKTQQQSFSSEQGQDQQSILGSDISEKQVKSQDGQELGEVDDLALFLDGGKIGYVLVSEEGQGGQKWKPVPATALEISGQGEQIELKVNIDQQKWEQLKSVSQQDLAQLSEEARAKEIHEAFSENFQADSQQGELQLASLVMENKLKNQEDQEIGQVKDLVMNPQDSSIGFLLIESENAEGTFAVAPQAIQKSAEGQYELNLTEQAFQQAQTLKMAEVAQKSKQSQSPEEAQKEPQVYKFQKSEGQESAIYGGRQEREKQQSQTESGSREAIRIGQPAPEVRVQQSSPEVSVQQAAPNVRVKQQPPQIRVQVEQPAPEVIVDQPEPEVNVQQAQPQVSVQQPEPEVTIQQAEPQVSVERGNPQVNVQKEGRAQIQVEREGEAQVIVERDGDMQEGTSYGTSEQRRKSRQQEQKSSEKN